jgi:hypothetical protein
MSRREGRYRPTLRAFFTNWRESPLPFHRKLGVALANNWRKLRTGKSCCGHFGEPGC